MKYKFAFFFVFLISILVRLPYLNRPLSGNYEGLMAHSLITYDIWKQDGITQHHFLPVYTYNDTTNHRIPIGDLGSVEKNGRFYYISYPAFGFIIPYITTFGYAHEPIVLKIFNIFLHLISAIFLWKILRSFFSSLATFLSVTFYLLQPNLLWFHGNIYFLDVLSMDILIIQLFVTLRYLEKPNPKHSILWLLINFLLCQTEWIGYLVLFTSGLYTIYKKQWKQFSVLFLWGLFNLVFTLWQFGSFLGYENYMNTLTQKGLKRIGNSDAISHHWGEWKPLFFFLINFLIYEFTLIVALFFNIGNTLTQIEYLQKNINLKLYAKLILLAGLPVLLHYFVLFNFTTGHTALAAVIANPFFILLLAPLLEMIANISNPIAKRMGLTMNIIIIILGLIFFLLRNNYYFQSYFKIHLTNFTFTPNKEFKELGTNIQKQTPTGYVSAILNPNFASNTQIIFYAKRNIIQFYTYQEAVEYAKKNQVKIKVFEINSFWKIIKTYEVLP